MMILYQYCWVRDHVDSEHERGSGNTKFFVGADLNDVMGVVKLRYDVFSEEF
jgi:hypothetical protein